MNHTKSLQDALPHFFAFFSEKTFLKFWKMDIFEMSKIRYIGKKLFKKSVVPFFKYNNIFKNMTIIYIINE